MRDPLRKTMALAGLVLTAAFLAGCGRNPAGTDPASAAPAEGTAAAPEAAPDQVVIDNFAYQPATLTVKAGTKVTWVNRDDVPHTATSTARPKRFDSRTLDTDDQFSHVFTAPGTYEYFCAVHPNMTGRVIVK
jgi:plastocyanin